MYMTVPSLALVSCETPCTSGGSELRTFGGAVGALKPLNSLSRPSRTLNWGMLTSLYTPSESCLDCALTSRVCGPDANTLDAQGLAVLPPKAIYTCELNDAQGSPSFSTTWGQ